MATIEQIKKIKREKADPWLNLFPLQYRGHAANCLLTPIREGITEYEDIKKYIQNELIRKKRWKALTGTAEIIEKELQNSLINNAIDYYIYYESLPITIKTYLKQEQTREFFLKKDNYDK